jgi:hypothetical protein
MTILLFGVHGTLLWVPEVTYRCIDSVASRVNKEVEESYFFPMASTSGIRTERD